MQPHQVAVYGTLKRGLPNHGYMRGARFMGDDWLTDITLYDLGYFPGAKLEPSGGIHVEIYQIDDSTLVALDRLEGYRPEQHELSLYHRVLLSSRFGTTWVYVYNHDVDDLPVIRQGAWSLR